MSYHPTELQLQNYIQNKLSDTETEQLELWLADHPEVMEDLEMGVMFKQADFDLSNKPIVSKLFNFLGFFTKKKFVPFHLLAYALVGVLIFNVLNTPAPSSNSAATFIELEKSRGTEAETYSFTHPKGNAITIRFFPDSDEDLYKVILKSESNPNEIVYENLKADSYGSITINYNNQNNYPKEWEVLVYRNNIQLEQNFKLKLMIE